jgi:hypothetical protein
MLGWGGMASLAHSRGWHAAIARRPAGAAARAACRGVREWSLVPETARPPAPHTFPDGPDKTAPGRVTGGTDERGGAWGAGRWYGVQVRLLDCLGGGRRREVQLGPILRSINSRSCPAAMAQRGFDAIASEAYCQVSDEEAQPAASHLGVPRAPHRGRAWGGRGASFINTIRMHRRGGGGVDAGLPRGGRCAAVFGVLFGSRFD